MSKLDEHERMLESLENQKKTQVKIKSFKDAKKTKDLIDMKNEKREKVVKEIEEFRQLIAENEQRLDASKKKFSKLEIKKVDMEKELREHEIRVVNLLLSESEYFGKEVDLYSTHKLYRSTLTDPKLYVTADSRPSESMLDISNLESEQNESGKHI